MAWRVGGQAVYPGQGLWPWWALLSGTTSSSWKSGSAPLEWDICAPQQGRPGTAPGDGQRTRSDLLDRPRRNRTGPRQATARPDSPTSQPAPGVQGGTTAPAQSCWAPSQPAGPTLAGFNLLGNNVDFTGKVVVGVWPEGANTPKDMAFETEVKPGNWYGYVADADGDNQTNERWFIAVHANTVAEFPKAFRSFEQATHLVVEAGRLAIVDTTTRGNERLTAIIKHGGGSGAVMGKALVADTGGDGQFPVTLHRTDGQVTGIAIAF